MKPYKNLGNPNDTPPNAIVVTTRRKVIILTVILVLITSVAAASIGMGIYLNVPTAIVPVAFFIFVIASLILSPMLTHKIKDVIHVESNALVGEKYGPIPFGSIIRYDLEDKRIKIYWEGRNTLLLKITQERHRYDELHAAFEAAISNWQARHPASEIKQAYFFGTWKAKVSGYFLLITGLGLLIVAQSLKMYGVIGGLSIGMGYAIFLIQSKRRR